MEQTKGRDRGIFSILYRTRFKAVKGDKTVVNLSLLFSVIALLSAPWLVVGGLIAALLTGCRFAIDREGRGFEQRFDNVVKNAATRVRNALSHVTAKS
jgi:hypothetical protein